MSFNLILFFLDKPGERVDKHQEEAPTFQLDWHPGEPLFYTISLEILLRKRKNIYKMGLDQDPQSKKQYKEIKMKTTKIQQTKSICN